MAGPKPKFIDSPYYVSKPGGGYLKPGAPADLQQELKDFLEGDEAEEVVIPQLTKADLDRL